MPFCILYTFVPSTLDFINCQIVKWLKSPNGANIVSIGFIVGVLKAIDEIMVPREDAGALSRTPIGATRKTSNI